MGRLAWQACRLQVDHWHVMGYNNKVSTRYDVVYLKGYSDRLLGALKNVIEEKAGQMEQIEAIKL